MLVRQLQPTRKYSKSLIEKIRKSPLRTLHLQQDSMEYVRVKKTVVNLAHNDHFIGTVKARTQEEAKRIVDSRNIELRIGWDKNRNEKLLAVFA